jgi:hypothetical protein
MWVLNLLQTMLPEAPPMKKNPILKKNGKPSPFFWTDTDGADQARQTVYKQTESGVKKMKGVTYDVSANQVNKD